jgi:hypothetical protein
VMKALPTELAAAIITKAGSTDFDSVIKAGEGFIYESVAGPLVIRACDHQVQIGQATGQVVPTTNNPYPFPFIGTAFTAPLSAIAVAPQNTGNPRCTSTASN